MGSRAKRAGATDVRIDYLADHPEFIPTLAHWHHEEWGYLNSGHAVERRIEDLRGHTRGGIPTTVVAHADGALLGSASLIESDMDTRPDLTPWLASVIVAPEQRGRGIGSALVMRIVDEARAERVDILYLFTMDQERLYARLGWSILERTRYRDVSVVVMLLKLSGTPRSPSRSGEFAPP